MKRLFPIPCRICSRSSGAGLCEEHLAGFASARCRREHSLAFSDGAVTCLSYRSEATELLFLCKSLGEHSAVDLLMREMLPEASALCQKVSCVTFVPRRRRVRAVTGVDQAELLARALAKELGVSCVRLLRRRTTSRRQHGLNRAERRENMKGAFAFSSRVVPTSVLLIDDVITTGATVSECARVLKEGGVRRVWALAALFGGRDEEDA